MTQLGKLTLAATLAIGALGASAAVAGDLLQTKDQLRLRDGSCLETAELLLADETLTMDQVQDRLRDCSCLDDDDATCVPLQTRTRTGEDNGNGNVWRHRSEGGVKAQSGSGRN